MKSVKLVTRNPQETVLLGKDLAKKLKPGHIVCLFGELGSGKTTLVKGIAKGLNIKESQVNSPTFVFMNIYEGRHPLYHFDLYRVERPEEIGGLGYEEFLFDEGVSVIEWAERLGDLMPKEYLAVHMTIGKNQERFMRIEASGKAYAPFVENL